MPYVHGITKEDVFNAASTVFAQGKNPTQAAIRSALGKGSFSTISKYLAEWREQQTDVEAVTNNADDMPDQVRTLLNRTYAAIRAHTESTVVGEQTSLLEQENERLKDKLVHHEEIAAELAGIRFTYQELMDRADRVTRENERINKYLPQINQVEQLVVERQRLGEEVSDLRETNGKLELEKAHLEDQLQTTQRNLQTAIERANGMEQELHHCHTENSKLNNQLTQIADRNQELLGKQSAYEDAIASKLAEIEELKNELKLAKQSPTRKPSTRKPKGSQSSTSSNS